MAGKPWFVPHSHGYGAFPCSWQGWALIAAVVAVIVLLAIVALQGGPTPLGIAGFAVGSLVAVGVLVVIARAKTEGGWRWRWGEEE